MGPSIEDEAKARTMANGAGRRGIRQPRSHEDIYDAVERVERKADAAKTKAEKVESDLGVYAGTLQRIETAVGDVKTDVGHMKEAIGFETEPKANGDRDGTGLVGFVLRLDGRVTKRFGIYDGWTRTAIGFAAACAVLIPVFWTVFWWLTSGRLEHVLK